MSSTSTPFQTKNKNLLSPADTRPLPSESSSGGYVRAKSPVCSLFQPVSTLPICLKRGRFADRSQFALKMDGNMVADFGHFFAIDPKNSAMPRVIWRGFLEVPGSDTL
jgi:hypothetical protein